MGCVFYLNSRDGTSERVGERETKCRGGGERRKRDRTRGAQICNFKIFRRVYERKGSVAGGCAVEGGGEYGLEGEAEGFKSPSRRPLARVPAQLLF